MVFVSAFFAYAMAYITEAAACVVLHRVRLHVACCLLGVP